MFQNQILVSIVIALLAISTTIGAETESSPLEVAEIGLAAATEESVESSDSPTCTCDKSETAQTKKQLEPEIKEINKLLADDKKSKRKTKPITETITVERDSPIVKPAKAEVEGTNEKEPECNLSNGDAQDKEDEKSPKQPKSKGGEKDKKSLKKRSKRDTKGKGKSTKRKESTKDKNAGRKQKSGKNRK